MKVMIVVTHLLGSGHLARAITLARGFCAAGHRVRVISGGRPANHLDADGIEVIQLPAVQSNGVDFTRLLDEEGTSASESLLQNRISILLDQLDKFTPDVVITELFPFGRRILRDEFLALLKAAKARPRAPLICASIRDILAPPSKPRKADFAEETIKEYYDAVLVHSDRDLMPLELSWPVSDALSDFLQYTGFVASPPAAPPPDGLGAGEVIVSAGGGDVGHRLFDCAVQAAHQALTIRWRLLIGGQDREAQCRNIASRAPANLIAEPARPEFRSMLYGARASVSLCGYNTALDVLQAGCPAIFVPFDAGSEVEQGIRASALSARPGLTRIATKDLTPETLLEALELVTQEASQDTQEPEFDGAARTVAIVENLWGRMR